MVKYIWRALIVGGALSLLPGAVPAQTDSPQLDGGVWAGQYWPSDAHLYSVSEPVLDQPGRRQFSNASITEGGLIVGGWGTVTRPSWPVALRVSVAQVRGGEVTITGGIESPGPCPAHLCFSGARYTSPLTVTIAQLDAVARPLGSIGPLEPRAVVGLTGRYDDYGPRNLQETVGTEDTADIRFPEDDVVLAFHLGSEVAVSVLGLSPSVRFGDLVSMDARGGWPDLAPVQPFLRHDLYLAVGVGLP